MERLLDVLFSWLNVPLGIAFFLVYSLMAHYFFAMLVVSLYLILLKDSFDVLLVVNVKLPQFLLQFSFILIQVHQVLPDKGLNIDLQIIGGQRIIIICPGRQRRHHL